MTRIISFYRVEHIDTHQGPYNSDTQGVFPSGATEAHPSPGAEGLIGYFFDRLSYFGFTSPRQLNRWMDAKVFDGDSILDRLHERRNGRYVIRHFLVDASHVKASMTQAICRISELTEAVKTYSIPEWVKLSTGKDLTPCVTSPEVTKSTNAESTAISSGPAPLDSTSTSCTPQTRRPSQDATSGSRISAYSARESVLDALIERQAKEVRERFDRLMPGYWRGVRQQLGLWEQTLSSSSETEPSPPSTSTPSVGSTEPWRLTGLLQRVSSPSTCRSGETSSDRFGTTGSGTPSQMEDTTVRSALSGSWWETTR